VYGYYAFFIIILLEFCSFSHKKKRQKKRKEKIEWMLVDYLLIIKYDILYEKVRWEMSAAANDS
jgi:hypothetical protein